MPGYAGHLVRDLSNTHVMIVGGGTLIATGVCWFALPRIVGRPLASNGLAQSAFWFTAVGLFIFYVAFVANGIAMGRLVAHGWDYQAAKDHMGNWYRVPVGMGAGVMGLGYWCFAATCSSPASRHVWCACASPTATCSSSSPPGRLG